MPHTVVRNSWESWAAQVVWYLWLGMFSLNDVCALQPYPEDPAVYKPLSQEELQRIKSEKKQKQNEKKQKITENRKHLASVRVVQRNLVFVVGLSQRLADPEVRQNIHTHTHTQLRKYFTGLMLTLHFC